MTTDEITAWVHEHVATVTIVPDIERYTALETTIEAAGRSVKTAGTWGLMDGVGRAIAAYEQVHGS